MRADKRLLLAQDCPKFREIEASAPLFIKCLVFSSPTQIIVDNSIYHTSYCNDRLLCKDHPKEGSKDKCPWMVLTMKSKLCSRTEKFRQENSTPESAMDFLVTKFFGGRAMPIFVHELVFEHKGPFQGYPQDMMFKIEQLKISHDASACMDAMTPFLDPSSFPLDTVHITGARTKASGNYDHPLIASAEYLQILDTSCKYWTKKIHTLGSRQIHLQCPDVRFQEVLSMLENLITTAKPVGTWISVGMDRYEDIKEVIDGVKRIPLARTEPSGTPCGCFTEAVLLPLTTNRQMLVYVSPNEHYLTLKTHFSKFDMNFVIMEIRLPQDEIRRFLAED